MGSGSTVSSMATRRYWALFSLSLSHFPLHFTQKLLLWVIIFFQSVNKNSIYKLQKANAIRLSCCRSCCCCCCFYSHISKPWVCSVCIWFFIFVPSYTATNVEHAFILEISRLHIDSQTEMNFVQAQWLCRSQCTWITTGCTAFVAVFLGVSILHNSFLDIYVHFRFLWSHNFHSYL